MALVFMDSFDHYATDDLMKKWDYEGGYIWGHNYIGYTLGMQRRPNTKYYYAADHWIEKDIVDTITGLDIYTFVIGYACYYQTGCPEMYVNLMNASRNNKIQLRTTTDGKVKIYRGGTLLEETPQNYVSPNT